jgi:glycosyltransferase involved in cell wall biosynthesis
MNKILTIGPDYKTLKGGVASVLSVYAKYDKSFKFLPTYSSEKNILNVLLFPLKYFKILFFLLFNPSYKIVHIHGASRISFYRKYFLFLNIKYLLGRKVVYHIHGAEYHLFMEESSPFIKKCILNMLEQSDAVICLSIQWKDFFKKQANLKSIYILNNTISMPVEYIKTKQSDKIIFLLLGRIGERKGIFDLINVIGENQDYFRDKIKVIIGGDGEIERMLNEIRQYNIEDIIDYVGWVSGDDKDKLLIKSDVNILPSYNEGLPISILESMSYKMPIISTDVGGISTIVKNNYNGFLIEAGDIKELFNSMKYFIENKTKIAEYGNNSFEIIQDFLPEKVIKDLHKIYDALLKVKNGN